MAKTLTDEDIKLNVIINDNTAQKELFDLEKSTRKLTEANKQLKLQKQLLEKQGKKDTDQYRALSKAMRENNTQITQNKAKMAELQKQIGITGLTMKQLMDKSRMLKLSLQNAIPGSSAHQRYKNELQQITARITELNGKARQAGLSLGAMADKFNRYSGIGLSFIAFLTGVVFSIQKILDINGKLSDSLASVRKTTGMTADEVDNLAKSFGLFLTRTSRAELLGIAKVGGLLGIAKKDIGDFVFVMNKANVALGEDFEGGAEGVATKLGKIKGLYEELKDASVNMAFEATGSALNDLGADGAATEENIADFVTRVGTLPGALKPAINEALGLGAAFEESGLKAEIAATNYGKVISIAARDYPKFASVMGKSNKEIKDLINNNPTEFFLQFANSLKNMDATQLAKTLDYLKLNDNEVKMVLGAAGANVDMFRDKIKMAGKSMDDATSLTNEYNIMNNTLAATLEKISKKISGWFSSEAVNQFIFDIVNGFGWLIGATEDTDGSQKKFRNTLFFTAKIIGVVTAAIITNVGWQKLVALWTTRNTQATLLYNIASKARAFADGLVIVSTQLLAGVTMLLTGNIRGASQAFRVMTATMMTTPWGFILGMIAAIGTAYMLFSDEAKKAATAQSMMADTAQKTSDLLQEETAAFKNYIAIAQDSGAPIEARTKALEAAKKIGGEYVEGLNLENVATFEGKKMIDAYITSLREKIQLQVLEEKQKDLIRKINEKRNQSLEEEVDWLDKIWAHAKNLGNQNLASNDLVLTSVERRSEALKELQRQLNFTEEEMKEFLKKNPDVIKVDPNAPDFNVPDKEGTTKKNPNSTAAELAKLRLDAERSFADEMLKLQRQLEDDRVAAMEEGALKRETIENLRYKREMEDMSRQKVKASEMAKLDEDIAKAKEAGDITKYQTLLTIKAYWEQKNAELDSKVQEIAEGKFRIHQLNIAKIGEEAAKERITKANEQYEREKIIRETAYNEELAKLGNNEIAKAKLKRNYEAEELRIQREHLEKLISEYQLAIADMQSDVDFSLFSPEQKQAVYDEVDKLKLKISELLAKIAELKGNPASGTDFNILSGAGTDILGFSPEQWEQVFSNLDTAEQKIQAFGTVIGGLQNVWSMYSGFAEANLQRELNALERSGNTKKRKLKQQLDQGLINQAQYKKGVEKIDTDIEKKRAELEYKKARNERIGALFGIASNTALGIMKAVAASPLTGGMPWAGIIAGMGALQAAMVLASPMPAKGAEKGLYNPEYIKRSQDGKVFKNTGTTSMKTGAFSKPTLLVGEGPGDMPEMVIDKRSFARISPSVKEALIRELNGVRGFENGYYDNLGRYTVPVGNQPKPTNNNNDDLILMLMGVVKENTEVMRDLKDKGVKGKFFRDDKASMRELEKGLKEYKQLEDNARK